tara:strand:+ start:1134 stop:1604 length:471 start_codon:yes stop_codon:yes gene_type:complete
VKNELFAALLMLPLCAAAVDDFPPVTVEERHCMAEAMYFEARGEGWLGMVAVGAVIKNRVDDRRYPSTVCGVVHQGAERKDRLCAFSYYCDGLPERPGNQELWELAQLMADAVLSSGGVSVNGVGEATHYHAMYVTPWWAPALDRQGCIGNHVFYK